MNLEDCPKHRNIDNAVYPFVCECEELPEEIPLPPSNPYLIANKEDLPPSKEAIDKYLRKNYPVIYEEFFNDDEYWNREEK
jgi:hypothetical protein